MTSRQAKHLWLDEVGRVLSPLRYGEKTYAGSYQLVYFDGFRALIAKVNGKEKLFGPVPHHARGAYAAAQHFGV